MTNPKINEFIFEDEEWISINELYIRQIIIFIFRFVLGIFCSAQLWDFMFNPIWMHGYLWSLNQPYAIEGEFLSEKSALDILEHQNIIYGKWHQFIYPLISTLGTWLILRLTGFSKTYRTVWRLVLISICCGFITAFITLFLQQKRLFPCIHESFFVFLIIFFNGICLTIKWKQTNKLLKIIII
ncbi:hypothetical protein Mgra_00000141 [Meloidogyne graminicola]|uniref:Uncharacterized protein n=1 Tax=Meloidogyne graminicola TaxID=189291 RepID=A0A8T0A2L0_9BILA|nr:hypothetical protein Mgra_00000141 [Meloidogyne graminicola]